MSERPFLKQLFIYPVKSLAGIELPEALPTEKGLQYDRRWMLVDTRHQFLSQRSHPKMALLRTEIDGDTLLFHPIHSSDQPLSIALQPNLASAKLSVTVWEDTVSARVYPPGINAWFTRQLGSDCQLVYMPDQAERRVDPVYAKNKDTVSFADGFPYLITTEASLNDLNSRLKVPVGMERFRPNLVIGGTLEPWIEDSWLTITIGDHHFRYTKPCGRCQVITIDPSTAERGSEPLRTLAGFRQKGKNILFGLNACWHPTSISSAQKLRTGAPLDWAV